MTDENEIKINGLDEPIKSAAQSVVAPQAGGVRNYFVDEKSSYADRAVMPDGTWFELVPLDEEEIERYNETATRWCEAIGWTQEMLRTATLLERGIPADTLKLSAEELQTLILTPEQERTKTSIQDEARNRVVINSVVGWSLAPRCTDERKAKLHKDIRRLLCDRAIGFSVYGLSDARFCDASDTTVAKR